MTAQSGSSTTTTADYSPPRQYPVTLEDAREWIDTLRDALHRERRYIETLEHDVSLLRDGIDTVLWQGGLAKTTMRRVLRTASAGCTYGLNRPYELSGVPEWRREQILDWNPRHKGLVS